MKECSLGSGRFDGSHRLSLPAFCGMGIGFEATGIGFYLRVLQSEKREPGFCCCSPLFISGKQRLNGIELW